MRNHQDDYLLFCELVDHVVNIEGGFVDDPDDPGGPTKYGVAWNYNSAILTSLGYTRDTVDQLTEEHARRVYYLRYWLPSLTNTIPNKRLAFIHFDAAVNCGVGQAKIFLSRLSKEPKNYEDAPGKNVDLWWRLVQEYLAHRMHFYSHATNRRKYIDGWINRLVLVIRKALTF